MPEPTSTSEPLPAAEVRLTDETIAYLSEKMAEAAATALKQSLNEDTAKMFWTAGVSMLQEQAANKTGRFVIGSFSVLAKKALLFAALGSLVYAIGGWDALARLFKAIFPGS